MLDGVEVWPVRTNAGFLFNALLHPDFGAAKIDTGFIERNLDALVPDPEPDEPISARRGGGRAGAAEDEEPLAVRACRLQRTRAHAVALVEARCAKRVAR